MTLVGLYCQGRNEDTRYPSASQVPIPAAIRALEQHPPTFLRKEGLRRSGVHRQRIDKIAGQTGAGCIPAATTVCALKARRHLFPA